MSQNIISVSTLVHYIKGKLESDQLIQKVLVEGEISNFSNYRSGHWYFSLKDENSLIRCVMFSSSNKKVSFLPKDGDKVIIQADVSVYEQRGDIQLIVTNMKSDRVGDLYLEFERLKKKLYNEGLFEESHKKSIPTYPMRIGLVTGANTAARSDVLTTLQRRWPIAEIVEFNCLVQGNNSSEQVIDALYKADKAKVDVILLVRGGGSIEDLWSFNDENLARVIYNLNTPIITGIGHEINFTISDYVADLRAPTPTGAAERCAPNMVEVLSNLSVIRQRLNTMITHKIDTSKNELESYKSSYVFTTPERLYSDKVIQLENKSNTINHLLNSYQNERINNLNDYSNRLVTSISKSTNDLKSKLQIFKQSIEYSEINIPITKRNALKQRALLLDAYSPLKSLTRGFTILENKEGKMIKSANNISVGDQISIQLQDGTVIATANKIIKE